MLVLTRKPGEAIRITGPCTITVLTVEGGRQVRIGLVGPETTEFLRTELEEGERSDDARDKQ